MNVFRVLVESITDGIYRVFHGTGRPQETCSGLLFQHYGLRTQPPANVDLFTLQYGNNHFSVAENDGGRLGIDLNSGDVYLYTDSTNYIHIVPTGSISITTPSTVISQTPANAQAIMTEAYKTALETFLGPSGPLQLAIAAGVSSAGGTYTPATFVPPTNGLTSTVELE